MTDQDILTVLKSDLNISVTSRDAYLLNLIVAARAYIVGEGITLADESVPDGMLVEMYAAYLYRKRNEQETTMPRYLRWALNNRLMSEVGNLGD